VAKRILEPVNFSEAEIERRIEELDGASFQLLCEDYAQIKFPEPWRWHLDPRGRRADGHTIRGSPDFFGRTREGVLVVGEASKQDDWYGWLAKDLNEWECRGETVAAFYAFSWHPFTPDRARDCQKLLEVQRLASEYLALPSENLVLVFRRELVRDLAQPAYAQVVRRHLDLQWSVYPFLPIDLIPRGPQSDGTHSDITPVLDEYLSNAVEVPDRHLRVLDAALTRDREALVSGPSASGKTVLVLAYAIKSLSLCRPVFYVDCKELYTETAVDKALEVLESWRSAELLVVLDNIHLLGADLDFLQRHVRAMQCSAPGVLLPNAFSVIYVRRPQRLQFPLRDGLSERIQAARGLVDVVADEEAFRVVHDRMARHHGITPARRPREVWQKLADAFGQNLFFFAVAANAAGKKLADPHYRLEPKLARAEIQERYLLPLGNDPDAYHNFLVICVLAELELSAPQDALRVPTPFAQPFGRLVGDGLVYERERPDGRRLYDLEHPSVGTLVLEVEPTRPDRGELLHEACARAPGLVVQILNRAWLEGRGSGPFDPSGLRLQRLLVDGAFLGASLRQFGAQEWRLLLLLLHRTDPSSLKVLTTALGTEEAREQLLRMLTEAPLDKLAVLLRDLERLAPAVWLSVKVALEGPQLPSLYLRAITTPPHFLKAFLQYAEKALPEAYTALTAYLQSADGRKALADLAAASSLFNLRPLLEYLHKANPVLFAALVQDLSISSYRSRVLQMAMQTRLDGVADFLRFADRHAPAMAANLRVDLEAPQAVDALAERAIHDSPLSNIWPFLKYAGRTTPRVEVALRKALELPRYRQRWLSLVLQTPPYYLEPFFAYATTYLPTVVANLKADLAQPSSRQKMLELVRLLPLHLLARFVSFADRQLGDLGDAIRQDLARPEVLEACTRAAAETSLGDLTRFLSQAKISIPGLWAAVSATLLDESNETSLVRRLCDAPVEQLRAFLEYLDSEHQDRSLRLRRSLDAAPERQRLLRRALDGPLEHLARFLEYAEDAVPGIWQEILGELCAGEREPLLLRVVDTPVEHLTGFLRYAQGNMPVVWTHLREDLRRDDMLTRLMTRVRDAEPRKVQSFERYMSGEMPEVLQRLRELARDRKPGRVSEESNQADTCARRNSG
jgi:hypothetical protein